MGHDNRPSQDGASSPPTPVPVLLPEIRSVLELSIAHAHKVYFSGPLVQRIERLPDGFKPAKDMGWTEVWGQLGGTTLSIWSMKDIEEAAKQGREVPPSYINVTDAFFQVLGSVTIPMTTTTPSKRYTNVFTLNHAGANLHLYSCPSVNALISWAAALRLATWEKSRLEEIYTAHLLRVYLNAHKYDIPTSLVQGRKEGWARIRIAGRTDWMRVWLSIQVGTNLAPPRNTTKPKRRSALFQREELEQPMETTLFMFHSPKLKDRKKPLLTISNLSQAFAVYPERPELITKSALIKIEGTFGDEGMAGTLQTREGWVLLLPECEMGSGTAQEMLQWVVALHDAFEMYGRPQTWRWNPREAVSLMFGYPVGPHKDNLLLDREPVESLDPRVDATSAVRSEMKNLLWKRMRPEVQDGSSAQPPATTTNLDGSDSYGAEVQPQAVSSPPCASTISPQSSPPSSGVPASTDIASTFDRPRTPRPEN